MLRQACRVDSLCDHSMPEELILFVGRLLRALSRRDGLAVLLVTR